MIETLSLEEFQENVATFENAVMKTTGISTLCSASDWQLAGARHFQNRALPTIHREGDHWLAWSYGGFQELECAYRPLEFAWAFGCPLVGGETEARVEWFRAWLEQDAAPWQLLILTGIEAESDFFSSLSRHICTRYHAQWVSGASCDIADLSEGVEAWFSRRSRSFRANLRRSEKLAQEEGITYEYFDQICKGKALFQRVLALEKRSWKTKNHLSIYKQRSYRSFYQELCERMGQSGRLRMLFLQHDGQDVAYIYGGVLGSVYRGFQLSYDDQFAHLGLGNLIQWMLLQRLHQEGIATYDLGMEMEYKKRWSDRLLRLDNLILHNF